MAERVPNEINDAGAVTDECKSSAGKDEENPQRPLNPEKFTNNKAGKDTALKRADSAAAFAHLKWNAVRKYGFACHRQGEAHEAVEANRCFHDLCSEAMDEGKLDR